MIFGSHNSWSYLKPKKWWMRAIAFTAKCQRVDILSQYILYGVRCFDLRVRFDSNGKLVIAHGLVEYDITQEKLLKQLNVLNHSGGVYIRVLHEVRNDSQHTLESVISFKNFCDFLCEEYQNIIFWGGGTAYNKDQDYVFKHNFSCEGRYASACPPKLLDDWIPILYAKMNNSIGKHLPTDSDVLMVDFVDID